MYGFFGDKIQQYNNEGGGTITYGYERVSTAAQELAVQTEMLKQEGCEVIYEEKFTGTKTDRPKFT